MRCLVLNSPPKKTPKMDQVRLSPSLYMHVVSIFSRKAGHFTSGSFVFKKRCDIALYAFT